MRLDSSQEAFLVELKAKAVARGMNLPSLNGHLKSAGVLVELEVDDGLVGQVVEDRSNRVRIEIKKDWIDPPTYQDYKRAANEVFRSLLADLEPPLRLTIQSKTDCEPKLTPGAKRYFDPFVAFARLASLQQYDWEHFYKFIYYCHKHHMKLSAPDLEWLLIQEGIAEDRATTLSDVYRHGRVLLGTQLLHREEWERSSVEVMRCKNPKCDFTERKKARS